jgi:hypothetical protein
MASERPTNSALSEVNFYCKNCKATFTAAPEHIEDAPENNHPYLYFSACPTCAIHCQQAAWHKGVLNAMGKQTGPKTEAGKAASAKNLVGHPTPEAMQTIRFNAVTHGLTAQVATCHPAKPGKYPQCEGCEHLQDRSCVPYNACLKKAELYLKTHKAFEANDPQLLRQEFANIQASLLAMVNEIILTIALDGGVRIKTPEWYHDKDGGFHLARFRDTATGEMVQLHKIEAHPLVKPLLDLINKNSLSLADMGMTPKVQDQNEITQGFLDRESEKETTTTYESRISEQQKILSDLLNGSTQEHVVEGVIIDE